MVKINEMRCVYCGAYINEMHVTDPADGLHPEYNKNLKDDPKYCCYQCSVITEINRAYGDMIKGRKTPLEAAKVLREKAAYIKENGNVIQDHYIREWQNTCRRRREEKKKEN